MSKLTRLSKFLAYVLRHDAAAFGLVLDPEGFAELPAVWAIVEERHPQQYTLADLHAVAAGDATGKRRYEIRAGRIRAIYGHSAVRPVTYPPAVPPAILYHGTTRRALQAIRDRGLHPMRRQYVHLSTSIERATQVAVRRTRSPLILRIRARAAHDAGLTFYHPEPEHFLTRVVPAQFIEFPELVE